MDNIYTLGAFNIMYTIGKRKIILSYFQTNQHTPVVYIYRENEGSVFPHYFSYLSLSF